MKKKITCFALCLALTPAILSACGGIPESSGGSYVPESISVSDTEINSGTQETEDQQIPAAEQTVTPTPTAAPDPAPVDGTIHTSLTAVGDVYIAENKAFSPYYYADESGDAFSSMLNTVSERLGENVTLYNILAPTSFAVCLSPEVQAELGCSDEGYAIDYVNSRLADRIVSVEVLDQLIKYNGEYLYFGTDHHWTQLGAYYTYREWCKAKNITPHELSEYSYAEYPGFLGLFYNYSGNSEVLASNPDTVQVYIPIATNDMTVINSDGSEYADNIITDKSNSDAGSKYSCFLGGDLALCSITNPNISDGSSCLLVKDSFGNAFAPFLVDHYENVYVVDPRYYTGNLTSFVQEHNVSNVIMLYNVDQILGSTSEQVLSLFQ